VQHYQWSLLKIPGKSQLIRKLYGGRSVLAWPAYYALFSGLYHHMDKSKSYAFSFFFGVSFFRPSWSTRENVDKLLYRKWIKRTCEETKNLCQKVQWDKHKITNHGIEKVLIIFQLEKQGELENVTAKSMHFNDCAEHPIIAHHRNKVFAVSWGCSQRRKCTIPHGWGKVRKAIVWPSNNFAE